MRGRLVVRATAVGHETALGRIIDRVEQAQEDHGQFQTVGENFSRRVVPASFALSALTLLVTRDVRRAMTMLLVACPCAVGLSTPTAISAAIGDGARRGMLIKGGSHLEQAGRVDAIVFDKTGTLTVGRPVVTNVVSFDDDWEPGQVLAFAASSEIHSRHPLAEVVIRSTGNDTSRSRRTNSARSSWAWACAPPPVIERCCWATGRCSRVRTSRSPTLRSTGWIDCSARQRPLCCWRSTDGHLVGLVSLSDEVRRTD